MLFFLFACLPASKPADTVTPIEDEDTALAEDTASPASGTRGVWAWRDAGDPNGTDAVVGVSAAEDDMIAALTDWGVVRVYGSYGDRAATEPTVIAAWNAKLHQAGIESHVLVGDPDWISSREWAYMETVIQARLLDFNAAQADPLDRFDGLHLDIEPQGGSYWDAAGETDRFTYLQLLAETYDQVRIVVDVSDPSLPIRADLPVWFDKLPASLGGTGSIGWPATTDRDTWFSTLNVDGISMMAYERDSDTSITGAITDEETLFPGELRIGLNEEVGTTWADIDEMFTMATTLETQGYAVDLHSYSKIRAYLP
ncbi:MAG: hypothetical protein ACI8S6_001048 [Myxococcota bacterium]|jgi:hypothetical protein